MIDNFPLQLDFYRFSISWARVLPNGDLSNINEAGLAYYDKLINSCLRNGLQVMVTLHHYDTPHALDEQGGIINSTFVDHFKSFANLLFERFGSRVKYWVTFNEPYIYCLSLHGGGATFIPKTDGAREYKCSTNVLMAHASVYHLYQEKYQSQFKGKIGIVLNSDCHYGKPEDVDRAFQFRV